MAGPRAEFDAATLAKTEKMVGRRVVGEIVDLFLQHAPTEMAALGASVEAGDWAGTARAAHSLRASAFNVGALRLYDQAGELEQRAAAHEATAVRNDAELLRASFDNACRLLSEYRNSLSLPRVAVVEDNPDNRMLTRAILDSAFQIVEFDNGRDAIDALGASPPDLILLDISLPELDGIEVLRRMRAIEGLREVPVIALTAHAMSDDRARLIEQGFDEYVAKPIVDENDLIDPIRRLLGLAG